ncbi:MAG: hypothetical protein LUG99_22580 [Lachnospiraceae bacterium]|nr:hypothetical protein [Lachnospiraceae bacterium]
MPEQTMKPVTDIEDSLKDARMNDGLPDGFVTEAHLWDEILRKEVFTMPFLIFPLIYEVHGQYYPKDTTIVPFGTEYSVERVQTKDISSIRADTSFWITVWLYHFECEIGTDPEIEHRTFEYDTQAALACSKNQLVKDPKSLTFPYSAILFLKPGIRKPDRLTCRIQLSTYTADASSQTSSRTDTANRTYEDKTAVAPHTDTKYVDYEVAAVKVQSYTIQQIRERQLYILIPFTPLRFRPMLKKIREEKYDVESAKLKLTNYFQEIIIILNKAVAEGYLNENNRKDILSLLRKAMIRVFYKNDELLSEVIRMTTPLLELPSEIIARIEAEKDAEKDAEIKELTAIKDAEIKELTTIKDAEIKELTAQILELQAQNKRLTRKSRWKSIFFS